MYVYVCMSICLSMCAWAEHVWQSDVFCWPLLFIWPWQIFIIYIFIRDTFTAENAKDIDELRDGQTDGQTDGRKALSPSTQIDSWTDTQTNWILKFHPTLRLLSSPRLNFQIPCPPFLLRCPLLSYIHSGLFLQELLPIPFDFWSTSISTSSHLFSMHPWDPPGACLPLLWQFHISIYGWIIVLHKSSVTYGVRGRTKFLETKTPNLC